MKKLLYIFIIALSGQVYAQQQVVNLELQVVDIAGNPISFQPLTVTDHGTAIGITYNYITDMNGYVYDSLGVQGNSTLSAISTLNGCSDTAVFNYGTGGSVVYFMDTLQLCSAAVNCSFAYGTTPAGNPFAYGFWHQGNATVGAVWTFGDGTSSTQNAPTHTYAAAGTYTYCVTVTGCPQVCGTVTVPNGPPANCQASFVIDTATSQPGNVNVWNTSTPTYYPNTLTQYIWSFGDGTVDSSAFPSHTYAGPGTYVICLSIYVPPTAINPACTSTYCDTLSVDSLGNIIQKTTGTSFTLNVLNPNAIGVDENVATEFSIYPNPANEIIKIDFNATVSGNLNIEILDVNGRVIAVKNTNTQNGINQIQLNTTELTAGVYFVKLNLDGNVHFEKILKQ